jgi:small subunit ribosomal protein S8
MNKNIITIINNIKLAYKYKRLTLIVFYNKLNLKFIQFLYEQGYIRYYEINLNKTIKIYLVYYNDLSPVIKDIKIISKPSHKIYCNYNKLKTMNFNTLILSTSRGFMTQKEAIKIKQGGVIICIIY